MESPAVPALLIGALFVEKGLITQEQLDVALDEQQRKGNRLGEVLVERFGVSRLDLASALAEQWAEYERQGTSEQQEAHAEVRDLVAVSDEWSDSAPDEGESEATPKRPIGEIFLERGMVSASDLEVALGEQRESGRRLGEILVGQGNLSRLDLASALADQWASFQKLRPPSSANGIPPLQTSETAPAPVMPTPEVSSLPSAATGATSDQVDALRARLEALGAQLDQLSATTREWREPLDELSASIGERLSAVEQAAAEDATATEMAAIAARVDELAVSISTPSSEPLPADLLDRVDQIAAAIARQETRFGELASKEHEDRKDRVGREEIAALEARLEALATQPTTRLDELRSSLADLGSRVEQPAMSDEWREPLESLANDLRDRISTIEQAPTVDESTESLRAGLTGLAARIDAIPAPSEDWRGDLEGLTARIDEIASTPVESVDELRAELTRLDTRLSALPRPTDEWRTELGQVAENLRARFERVEVDLAARVAAGPLAEQYEMLRGEFDLLSSRVAAIPQPSGEWRDGLAQLSARIDDLPAPTDEWKIELGRLAVSLRARFEHVEADLAARASEGIVSDQPDGLRQMIDDLAARVDTIPVPTDEWKIELGQVAENLRARFDRVEADLATRGEDGVVTEQLERLRQTLGALESRVESIPEPNDEWREGLRALAARLDELPVPNQDWREALAGVGARIDAIPDNLSVRLNRIDHDLAARAEQGAIVELSERIEALDNTLPEQFDELRASHRELSERIDAIPPPADEWRHELAQVSDNLRRRVERVETGLEQRPGLDLLAGLRDELQVLSARIDADLRERDERAAGQRTHVEWLAGRVAQSDGLEQRLRDDFMPLVDGAVAPVTDRLAGLESSLEEQKAATAAVTLRQDDLTERIEKQARRIEKLRDDGPTATQVAAALGARLDASETVATDVYASLDERLSALDDQVAAASGRAASTVESLRRELDDLRRAAAVTVTSAEASTAHADHLAEQLRHETTASLVAQAAAVEALRAGLDERERAADERFSALEKSQAKRSDVRELRDALARVEQHISVETDKEDARVGAVEQAVREGLAGLGSRLTESEGAYFQAGDLLRRSIEHLGSAIRGADSYRLPVQEADAPFVATSFLAFAPTPEGYRLVELDGAAPVVGAEVDVPGSEMPLTVARLGASPLPFDRRPCAYLENSA
ncbi:MAG: hypothetical protein ABI927_00570 [Gaiellaceae bacterium]